MAIDTFGNKWIATDAGLLEFNENGILGIKEKYADPYTGMLKIFPNPARDNIQIVLPGASHYHFNELVVSNFLGRERLSDDGILRSGTIILNVANFSPGIYNIRIRKDGEKVLSGRFIVVK